MPHSRSRFLASLLQKQATLWPVLGILGARQVGKTTLALSELGIPTSISLDDLEAREEATRSPKTFLAKLPTPVVIDEVQKAPPLFDAIKLKVDQKRIPGSYFLTGSTSFSAKVGVRESLTGRMGLHYLHPLSLAELHSESFKEHSDFSQLQTAPRFKIEKAAHAMMTGGLPVPAFLRNADERERYWTAWLDTTLNRDLARLFKRGYDPEFAFSLLSKMGALLTEGELPTLKHFPQKAARIRSYFAAMEDIFILNRVLCHEAGIGKDAWLPFDCGFAAYLAGKSSGEGTMLSLARIFLWNEWLCDREYQGKRLPKVYYKSARGSPVDAILDGIPFKIVPSVTSVTTQLKWEERALHGAMKRLNSPIGYLIGPVDSATLVKKQGIGILPWSSWS